jgi:non-ribosomal peptide synthetase component F
MESDRPHVLANGAAAPRANPAPRFPWLKTYPAGVNWNETFTGRPLPSLLDEAAAQFGARACTNFLGKETSFATIQNLVDRVAAGLQKNGVTKGVNVGLLLPNCPSFVIFYFGILKAGGTVVNFNPLYTVHELAAQATEGAVPESRGAAGIGRPATRRRLPLHEIATGREVALIPRGEIRRSLIVEILGPGR